MKTLRLARRLGRLGPMGLFGALVVLLTLLVTLFGPMVVGAHPNQMYLGSVLRPPELHDLFGTDQYGRNILIRVVYGARYSLAQAIIIVGVAAIIGVTVGALAGFKRNGAFDMVSMRIADIFLSIPPIILAIAMAMALGPGLVTAGVAVGLVWWPSYARLTRSTVRQVRSLEFVEAARSLGMSDTRILLRHVLPNSVGVLVTKATTDFGWAILFGATLSFLGIGLPPPTPDWGSMVADGQSVLLTAWWVATLPGAVIFVTVLGFTLFGDALYNLWNPKSRRRT